MIDIRSLEIKEICELSEALGEKAFRGKQISEWLCRGASSFGEMTNLPASFRAKLEESLLDDKGEIWIDINYIFNDTA